MAEKTYNVGIYCRLSNDDERDGESVSIENQKLLLQRYVRERGWNEIDTYIDDGFSGTNFQRPGFQEMLSEIEAGKIGTILVKDGCVNIELNSESPQKCGFCDVSSVLTHPSLTTRHSILSARISRIIR